MPKLPKLPKFNIGNKNKNTGNRDVWVFAEVLRGRLSPTVYELLTVGRTLADDLNQNLCAVLMGRNVKKFAKDLIRRGADIVYLIDSRNLDNYIDDNFAYALNDLVEKYRPNKFIFPASATGRGLSAKLAVYLGVGLSADATALSISKKDGMLYAERPAFGGQMMVTLSSDGKLPEMVSLRPMAYPKAQVNKKRKGKIIKKHFDTEKHFSPAKFISFIKSAAEGPDISEAQIVVAGGRGLRNAQGFKLVEELADLLGGAVGATRPAVDSGWVNYRHQIGLTGRTVKPKIYIACGISGQLHHTAGMSNSDRIIAINKDPNVPIMQMADYAVEGDAFQILPAMIAELKK